MTTQIIPYLHLNGKCREAMMFYQECLGGELTMQSIGESPMADEWPAALQNHILHASLTKGNLALLASDVNDGQKPNPGNGISLSLTCASPDEMRTFFASLSQGATVTRPIHEFFAGMMAALTDKFGVAWMFYAEKSN
jgi:PhnB protein